MKSRKIISCFIAIFSFNLVLGQIVNGDPNWKLQWQEDFNTIDDTKWTKANYADHSKTGKSVFMANQVGVVPFSPTNNLLQLSMTVTPTTCPVPSPYPTTWAAGTCIAGKTYVKSSGWIETKAPLNAKFGYIEASVQISTPSYYKGFMPAFWIWQDPGPNIQSYTQNEIDVFEFIPKNPTYVIPTNVHLTYPSGSVYNEEIILYNGYHSMGKTFQNFSYTDWHTYGIEWSPSKIIWYVDGAPIRFLDNPGVLDAARIIFSMQDKIDDPSYGTYYNNYNAKMFVDWIRYYKLDNTECNTDYNYPNGTLYTLPNKTHRDINLGQNSTTNVIIPATNQPYYFHSTRNIIIRGEMNFPQFSNVSFIVDPNGCYE